MAGDSSFDIVSDYDEQELLNALDQTRRDVGTRYDLKDTKSEIVQNKETLVITTESPMTLKNVRDILESKAVKRNLSLKIFQYGKEEPAAGGRIRQEVKLMKGLTTEQGKELSKLIRDSFPKLKAQIQGEAVRVTGKSRDELQAVIQMLKQKDYPAALQFVNYR